MVDLQERRLDDVFHALGDVTRRHMLRSLADGERTVSQLAEPFQMSLAAASKHVKALERAGLIQREVRGRMHICRLDAGPLSSANEWLAFYERFWSARLDRLEGLLRQAARQAVGQSAPSRSRGRNAPEPPTSKRKRNST